MRCQQAASAFGRSIHRAPESEGVTNAETVRVRAKLETTREDSTSQQQKEFQHCSSRFDPNQLLCQPGRKSAKTIRAASKKPPNRARKSSARRNSFARNISARARTTNISSSPNRFPGPSTEAFQKHREETQRRDHRFAFRKARLRSLSQHRRDHRCGRQAAGHLSQDAHPG